MKAVLCIDVEPDSRTPDPSAPVGWGGAEQLFDDHGWLRSRLNDQAINWYLRLDHQVEHLHGDICWAAERFGGDLDTLIGAGDEVGVHPHNWRWTGEGWLPDGTTSWVVENAERALDAYASVFGSGPRSFRYGDRFLSDDVVRLLVEHPDVVVDMTAEPGVPACRGLVEEEGATGVTRHLDVGLGQRYHPDAGAVDIPSESGNLTMVPLTTAVHIDSGRIDTLTLWLPPEDFEQMLRLRLLDRDLDHLAFAIRSDTALIPWAVERTGQNLETLSRVVGDLEWVTASSLALASGDPGRPAPGLVGALAGTVDDVIRIIDQVPSGSARPVAEAVQALVQRNEELAALTSSMSATLIETEHHLAVAERVLAAKRAEVDALNLRLDTIEATVIWRVRAVLLPVLRPLTRARRRAVGAWSRVTRGSR